MDINPRVLERDGKKEFVIITYEEYEQMREQLCDYEDLRDLRDAKRAEQNAESVPLSDVKRTLGI